VRQDGKSQTAWKAVNHKTTLSCKKAKSEQKEKRKDSTEYSEYLGKKHAGGLKGSWGKGLRSLGIAESTWGDWHDVRDKGNQKPKKKGGGAEYM